MNKKLYEYKEILWAYGVAGYNRWAIPFCPIHRMELDYSDTQGFCEKCKKRYIWSKSRTDVADYLRRELGSAAYKDADVISIDGIQTPQLKTKIKLTDDNQEYWIESRLNESDKGRQLVLYAGEKGVASKAQVFVNTDQEKLSFDHKDRRPEEIFAKIEVTFKSGKRMSIDEPAER